VAKLIQALNVADAEKVLKGATRPFMSIYVRPGYDVPKTEEETRKTRKPSKVAV
jgi:hypothetical protein